MRSRRSEWACHIYRFLRKGIRLVFTVVLHINYGAYRVEIKIILIRSL